MLTMINHMFGLELRSTASPFQVRALFGIEKDPTKPLRPDRGPDFESLKHYDPVAFRTTGYSGAESLQYWAQQDAPISASAAQKFSHPLFRPQPKGVLYRLLFIPAHDLMASGVPIHGLPSIICLHSQYGVRSE